MNKIHITASVILLLFTLACGNKKRNIPFPAQGSEYLPPTIEKLTFSESQKLNWVYVSPDSVKPQEKKLDFSKIPSRPIDLGNPKPINSKITDTIFNLNNIAADSAFNMARMPVKPLKFKTNILGKPKRVKSGTPRLKDGASESLLLFGQDQGLPGTIGSCFMQDKNGILWIGTDNGICRFDGEYCEIYSIDQGLTYNWVTNLMEDNRGQIWLSYFGGNGLSVLDTKNGTIKHLTTTGGLISNNVQKIVQDRDGCIWLATGRGINIIDQKAGTIKNIINKNGDNNYFVSDVLLDSNDKMWLGVPGWGLGVIDTRKETLQRIGTAQGLGTPDVSRLTKDGNGQIWIGTFSGDIKIINEKLHTIKRISSSTEFGNSIIRGIAFDKNGRAWIGTNGNGVKVYDPKSETIKNLSTGEGLSNDNVIPVFTDQQGQIWIGTNGGEANIYYTNGGNLHHLNGARGLSNNTSFIYGFTEDSLSGYWVDAGGILDIIDDKNQTVKSISPEMSFNVNPNGLFTDSRGRVWTGGSNGVNIIDEKEGTIKNYSAANGLSFFAQGSFTEDSKGQVWIGRGGVYVINENAGTIKYIRKANGLSNNGVECLMKNSHGQIWVGTVSGVDIIDEKAGTIKHISNKGLNNINMYNILEDKTGRLWITTYGNGLFMIDQKDGTITNFSVKNGLEDMSVYTVNERNGSIYVGTGRGINVIKPVYPDQNKSNEIVSWDIKSYGKPQGLLRVDHNPRSMLTKDGRLWWGIADVLTIMEEPTISTMVPTPYVTALQIMEQPLDFISNAWIKSKMSNTDTLWNTIADTFYTKNNFPSDSGYLQQNKISWDSVAGPYNMPVNLTLPFDQNHLAFYFTGTHLDNLNKSRYRYILEGNDEKWSDITDQAFADYRNLSSGKYTFKVCSRGFNGKWSTPVELSFMIRPPWWLSSWAYFFYSLCFLAFIFLVDKIQRKRLLSQEREKNREKELVQAKEIEKAYHELKTTQGQLIQSEKMASLGELTAGIAHEIQNPLNFVNNFSEVNTELIDEMQQELKAGKIDDAISISNDIRENEIKINHHGKRAGDIVKSMLQHSRTTSGQKELTDLNALADEYLRLSYHGLRAKDKSFNATMETSFDPNLPKIAVVPQDIGRVILNLITNAFYAVSQKSKVGSQKKESNYKPTVFVTTQLTANGQLLITIKDNGSGIPAHIKDKIFQPFFTTKPTGQGTGLGLSLAYDIVKAHGGELRVESKEGEGSEFIIQLLTN